MPRLPALVLGSMLAALPAIANATAEEKCPAQPVALPGEWTGWEDAMPVVSAASPDGLDAASIAPGAGIALRLHPDPEVAYVTLPQGAGEAASFGGLVQFHVERAGAYAVGLGNFAWVDLTRAGKPATPVSFGHGPDCTPIRKVVRFALVPGDYVVEVSGNTSNELRLMIGTGG